MQNLKRVFRLIKRKYLNFNVESLYYTNDELLTAKKARTLAADFNASPPNPKHVRMVMSQIERAAKSGQVSAALCVKDIPGSTTKIVALLEKQGFRIRSVTGTAICVSWT